MVIFEFDKKYSKKGIDKMMKCFYIKSIGSKHDAYEDIKWRKIV